MFDGKAVRLHPIRTNDRIGADAPGHLDQRLADVGMPEIDSFCPQSACQLKAMGVMVDTDHSFSAHEQRALNGKEANRAAAPYSHCVAFLDVGIVSGHTAGGNDRSEEHTSELQSLMRNSY